MQTSDVMITEIKSTPMANQLEKEWTDELYLANNIESNQGSVTRYCVGGMIAKILTGRSDDVVGWKFLGKNGHAILSQNNLGGRKAAIEAIQIHELGLIVPYHPKCQYNNSYWKPLTRPVTYQALGVK